MLKLHTYTVHVHNDMIITLTWYSNAKQFQYNTFTRFSVFGETSSG